MFLQKKKTKHLYTIKYNILLQKHKEISKMEYDYYNEEEYEVCVNDNDCVCGNCGCCQGEEWSEYELI